MCKTKALFDKTVSRKLPGRAEVLVVMYGSSRDSFMKVKGAGGLAVLNCVNSHPTEHNRYLIEMAGLNSGHHELIPGWVTARVEQEIDLADLIIVPSRFVGEQLRSYGVAEERIATIPYGVDLSAFCPANRSKPQSQDLECLYVGQISHRKGIPILLQAADLLRDAPVRFRLLGPLVSPEVLVSLPANVAYEGAVNPGVVSEAMRRADLCVRSADIGGCLRACRLRNEGCRAFSYSDRSRWCLRSD